MRFVPGLVCGCILALCLCVPAGLAQPAYTMPEYFAVDGVRSDDVLNVRDAPEAGANLIGSLAFDAEPVEVIHQEAGWAYVSTGEGMGWVSMAYLREISVQMIEDSSIPEGLVCSGTEPFWGLTLNAAGLVFDGVDIAESQFKMSGVNGFSGMGPFRSFVVGEGAGQSMTAIVSNEMCSDGMSDRDYSRRIDMVLFRPEGHVGYTGCCALPLN